MTSGRRPTSLIATSLFVLSLIAGCRDRLYDFGVEVVADGGRIERPSTDLTWPDVPPLPDGGVGGSGGRGGTAGGAGGASGSGAGGTGGSIPMCNNSSPDRQTDISNCGTCFNSCLMPNSNPACVAGMCKFTCFTDFFDADGIASNGCECVKTNAGVEACDALDDDCDGMVDEITSMSDKTADDRLVYFSGRNVTMFAHEASRYDATASDYGFDSTRRPCAVAGHKPWSKVTKEEAQAACARIGTGWGLCTAAEWADACNGSGNTTFPYGNAYSGTTCNGWDYPKAATATTLAGGAATGCVSDLSTASGDELYDMSGNVKEWVLSTTTTTGPFELRGGAYDIASFIDNTVVPAVRKAPGLQCDASVPAPATAVRLPSVGFRCCLTGQLPP